MEVMIPKGACWSHPHKLSSLNIISDFKFSVSSSAVSKEGSGRSDLIRADYAMCALKGILQLKECDTDSKQMSSLL